MNTKINELCNRIIEADHARWGMDRKHLALGINPPVNLIRKHIQIREALLNEISEELWSISRKSYEYSLEAFDE